MPVTTFNGNVIPLDLLPNILAGKMPSLAPSGYLGIQFVSGDFGSDAFDGITPATPLKNLDTAYNRMLGGANEIIFVLGGTAAVSYSSAIASAGSGLVWAKNYSHLVGIGSSPALGQRARITNGASTVLLTPLLSLTGNGCAFRNLEFFNGGAHATQAAVCIAITGSRNEFTNCQIAGGGNATNATNAAMRSLTIAGAGGENYFKHCTIGLTTIARNTTSAEIELKTATPRNVFEDCNIETYTSSATTLLVSIGALGIDRYVVFRNCMFLNPSTFAGGVAASQALSVNAGPGGVVMVHNSLSAGFTKFQTTASTAVFGDNPGSAAGGLGVALTS